MDFQDFLREQEEIYSRFGDKPRIREEGLVPEITKKHGGYLVAFRHPGHITSRVTDLSQRAARIIPSIGYNDQNAHTTLTDYGLEDGFVPNGRILDQLAEAVKSMRGTRPPCIDYRKWLYNQNSLIAAGYPDEEFFRAAQLLHESGRQQGLDFRLPWGAHITTNRLLENVEPEKLEELFRLVDSFPVLGRSTPFAIDVGYVSMSPEGFVFQTTERVLL